MTLATFRSLGTRDRRAIVLGGLALCALVATWLLSIAVPPLTALHRRNQVRSDDLARLARRPPSGVLRDSLGHLSAWFDTLQLQLLPGRSGTQVVSQLHGAIRQLASDAGLSVLSTRAESDSSAEAPFVLAVTSLEAEGDVSGVLQFLLLLDTARGLPRLRSLSITPLEPGGPDDRPEVIRLSAVVDAAGLLRAEAPIRGER